jgi:cytochrome c-type biogenesis protein CcmF
VRFQIRPLVNFLWLGAFIMALGGGIAATDRRYRIAKEAASEAATIPGVAG